MDALLVLILVLVVIGAGLKMAGGQLPPIDYPVDPVGEGRGPGMLDIQLEAPGFDEFGP